MVDRQVTVTTILRDRASRGLKGVATSITGVRNGVDKLTKSLGPLVTGFVGIAGAAALVRTATQSLSLAEAQVDAERQAAFAAERRGLALRDLLEIAQDLQAATNVGDENILGIEAALLNAGRAASSLRQETELVLDVAAATGASYDLVARAIGQFEQGSAGLLARLVPPLRAVAEEGRLAAEGISTLENLFSGAATAKAQTSFGQLRGVIASVGDEMEEIGKAVVPIAVALKGVALDALRNFNEVLRSDAATIFLGNIVAIVNATSALIPPILAFGGGFVALLTAIAAWNFLVPVLINSFVVLKAAMLGVGGLLGGPAGLIVAFSLLSSVVAGTGQSGFKKIALVVVGITLAIPPLLAGLSALFTVVSTVVGLLLGPVGLAIALVSIAVGVLKLTGVLDRMGAALQDSSTLFGGLFSALSGEFSTILQLFKEVASGSLSLGEAFDLLVDRGKALASGLFAGFKAFFTAIFKIGKSVFGALGTTIRILITNGVALALDAIASLLADTGFDRILGNVFAKAQSKLARFTDESKASLSAAYSNIGAVASSAAEEMVHAFATAAVGVEESAERIREALFEAARTRVIEQMTVDSDKFIKSLDLAAINIESTMGALARLQAVDAIDLEDLVNLDSTMFLEAVEALGDDAGKTLAAELIRQAQVAFEAGDIGLDQLLDAQTLATVGVLDQQLARTRELAAAQEEVVEQKRVEAAEAEALAQFLAEQVRFRKEFLSEGAFLDEAEDFSALVAASTEEVNRAAAAQEEVATALSKSKQLAAEALALEIQRAGAADELGAAQSAATAAVQDQVTALGSRFDSEIDRIANLARTGAGTQAQIDRQVSTAVANARVSLEELRRELDRLGDSEGVAALGLAIDDVALKINGADIAARSFGQGFQDGIAGLLRSLAEVGKVAEKIATTAVQGLTDSILAFVENGSAGFREFAANALREISRIILQAALLRSLFGSASGGGTGGLLGGIVSAFTQNKGGPAGSGGRRSVPLADFAASAYRFNTGGGVPGPRVNADIIPALLTPGEHVQPVPSVDYYGHQFMEDLRRRVIPRENLVAAGIIGSSRGRAASMKASFATGGSVVEGSGTAQIGAPNVGFIMDHETADRMFAGGLARSTQRTLGRNRGRYSAILDTSDLRQK